MSADTARRRINVLPEALIARIAAGEVVERPVSVVRELLDNAIDAGARHITVEVEGGGIALVRVSDDGHGIPPDEIETAFERHATSKLDGTLGLAGVATLGFRGEALPSIAAAADIEITSRHTAEPVGVKATIIQGATTSRRAVPSPVGTTIAVRELFGRIPARRAFMGSEQSEGRQVRVLVLQYALAYPEVAFTLLVGGRTVSRTPGTGSLRHAFASLHGTEEGSAMLDVTPDPEGDDGIIVTGLTGPPSVHRANRSLISVFINRRWVQSRALTFAIADAYRDQLPVGRHPVAAIDVRLPLDRVDINVHPAKAEVRFRDERAVTRALRHAVRRALEQTAVPSIRFEPASGRSAPPDDAAAAPPVLTLRERLGLPPEQADSRPLLQAQPTQGSLPLAPAGPVGSAPAESRSQREVLPLLRVVGQMASTYILAEAPDGLYIVDQHAAHERVLYDRLVGSAQDVTVQPLLEPAVLELDAVRAAIAAQYEPELASLGFTLDPFGERTWLVRAVPLPIASRDPAEAVTRLLDELDRDTREPDRLDRVAATIACHGSVRAGMALSMDEMRALVRDLEETADPRTCPHGRPTLLHLSRDSVERQFRRR